MTISGNLRYFNERLSAAKVKLIAISKTFPPEIIKEAYDCGHRNFGENKVQELLSKAEVLPADIKWHLVGHLQRNKIKYVVPFVHLIHSVDSLKLLKEINKEALKNKRVIDCLLQVYIASEETKFGLVRQEVFQLVNSNEFSEMKNIRICGLMGMATNTNDEVQVRNEFRSLKQLFEELKQSHFHDKEHFSEISMGMSSDWEIAVEEGSTMIRVGSAVFGTR